MRGNIGVSAAVPQVLCNSIENRCGTKAIRSVLTQLKAWIIGDENMLSTSVNLLSRVQQRDDEAAWDRFVTLYSPLLFLWVKRTGLGYQDCEDIVQRVFLKLINKLPFFDYAPAKGQFRSWLYTITINECRLRFRKLGLERELQNRLTDLERPEVKSQWELEYEEWLIQRALQLIASEFEEVTMNACLMTARDGMATAEVAEKLGISAGAVYIAKSRVLRRLREILDGLL